MRRSASHASSPHASSASCIQRVSSSMAYLQREDRGAHREPGLDAHEDVALAGELEEVEGLPLEGGKVVAERLEVSAHLGVAHRERPFELEIEIGLGRELQ